MTFPKALNKTDQQIRSTIKGYRTNKLSMEIFAKEFNTYRKEGKTLRELFKISDILFYNKYY